MSIFIWDANLWDGPLIVMITFFQCRLINVIMWLLKNETYPTMSWRRVCSEGFSRGVSGMSVQSSCIVATTTLALPLALLDISWAWLLSSRLVTAWKQKERISSIFSSNFKVVIFIRAWITNQSNLLCGVLIRRIRKMTVKSTVIAGQRALIHKIAWATRRKL